MNTPTIDWKFLWRGASFFMLQHFHKILGNFHTSIYAVNDAPVPCIIVEVVWLQQIRLCSCAAQYTQLMAISFCSLLHKLAISWTHYYQFWFDRMKIREISWENADEQKLECSQRNYLNPWTPLHCRNSARKPTPASFTRFTYSDHRSEYVISQLWSLKFLITKSVFQLFGH